MQYRDIRLKRGFRFVEAGDNLASAGGLTSGMDLALRVVERYYGREKAMMSLKLFAERVIPAFRPPARRIAAAE